MKLNLELSQKQLLSQKTIQSIELLQMSVQELNCYLNEVAMENPVIDLDAGLTRAKTKRQTGRRDDAEDGFANLCEDAEDTLQGFLHEQLLTRNFDDEKMMIAEYIIGCLDSKGYFRENVLETARNLGKSREKVEEVLLVLKQLEPAGVCASNLQECLLRQVQGEDAISVLARELIENHLEAVGKNQIFGIAKRLKKSVVDVEKACEKIRLLNPKPGNSFNSRECLKFIIPDVIVVRFGDRNEVFINDSYYPQISVEAYYRKLQKKQNSGETADYIDKKIQQAEWIRYCIEQRKDTLLKVTQGIVQCQKMFFSQENGKVRALKQAELAKLLDVHESTVSRAIKDKYLQCSQGIFPMQFFFSKGIEMQDQDGAVTVDAAKEILERIVKNEDRRHPCSDRIIAERMNDEGIKISRRTVTKYRNEMGIKDVSGRRLG